MAMNRREQRSLYRRIALCFLVVMVVMVVFHYMGSSTGPGTYKEWLADDPFVNGDAEHLSFVERLRPLVLHSAEKHVGEQDKDLEKHMRALMQRAVRSMQETTKQCEECVKAVLARPQGIRAPAQGAFCEHLFDEGAVQWGVVHQLLELPIGSTQFQRQNAKEIASFRRESTRLWALLSSLYPVLNEATLSSFPIFHMNNHGFAQRYWEYAKELTRRKDPAGKQQASPVLLHVDTHADTNEVEHTSTIAQAISRAGTAPLGAQGPSRPDIPWVHEGSPLTLGQALTQFSAIVFVVPRWVPTASAAENLPTNGMALVLLRPKGPNKQGILCHAFVLQTSKDGRLSTLRSAMHQYDYASQFHIFDGDLLLPDNCLQGGPECDGAQCKELDVKAHFEVVQRWPYDCTMAALSDAQKAHSVLQMPYVLDIDMDAFYIDKSEVDISNVYNTGFVQECIKRCVRNHHAVTSQWPESAQGAEVWCRSRIEEVQRASEAAKDAHTAECEDIDELSPLVAPPSVQDIGVKHGFVGIVGLLGHALDQGRVLSLSRLDARLQQFHTWLQAISKAAGAPVLVTLIDSVDLTPFFVQPSDDEGSKRGGPWLASDYAFFIKWRVYRMVLVLAMEHS